MFHTCISSHLYYLRQIRVAPKLVQTRVLQLHGQFGEDMDVGVSGCVGPI